MAKLLTHRIVSSPPVSDVQGIAPVAESSESGDSDTTETKKLWDDATLDSPVETIDSDNTHAQSSVACYFGSQGIEIFISGLDCCTDNVSQTQVTFESNVVFPSFFDETKKKSVLSLAGLCATENGSPHITVPVGNVFTQCFFSTGAFSYQDNVFLISVPDAFLPF
ncbi:MAG: hypothetical protein ABW189_08110 [Rickettsiales bacterium]